MGWRIRGLSGQVGLSALERLRRACRPGVVARSIGDDGRLILHDPQVVLGVLAFLHWATFHHEIEKARYEAKA